MALATSKLTSQGQISIPAAVRQKLGIGPGAVLEWNEENGVMTVRRSARYTSEQIHKVLFPDGPPKKFSVEEMNEGIRKRMRARYAGR